MLNDHGPTGQQPLLTDAAPRRSAATEREGEVRITVTIPPWLKDQIDEVLSIDMPGTSREELVRMALVSGVGALSALGDFRYRAAKAQPEPEYPFDRKHIPAFKALLAAVEAGPLTLDAVSVEPITGRMGSGSLRGIGTFLALLARKSPVLGLRVEALGRKPGRVTMDYRLSREGSTG
jgi:hypothetical protein